MAVFWIILIIEIMSYTPAGNGQCASSTNVVPVCTNSTDSYTQMNIPVNGSMADGCQCDVTLVTTPSSGQNIVSVSNVEDANECGYKVVNYNATTNYSWTCSNNEIVYYKLRLNESFQLTFTSDSTPASNSTGFCLHLTTTINNTATDNNFTITCWRKHTTPDTTSTTSTPQSVVTPKQTAPTSTITTLQNVSTTTPTSPTTTSQNVLLTSSTQQPVPTIVSMMSSTTSGGTQSSVDGSTITSSETSGYVSTEKVTGIPDAAIIGGGAAGACVLLIIIIVIIVCLMKRRKNNKYHKPSTRTNGDTGYEDVHPEEPIMMENNGDSQRAQGRPNSNNADEMIYLENDLYVSADSFPDNSTQTSRSPTSPDYTDIDDFPGRKPDKAQTIPPADVSMDKNSNVNNVYAVVNKKPKTEGTDGETNYYKDENQPHTFSVGQTPASNNIYAAVNKPPKNEKIDNLGEEPDHQTFAHNGENPREIFSVSETPNPNNAYAVVNKKSKVTDKPSKPETPLKPGKPPKPEKAVKPRVPSKPTTKL